MVLNDIDFEGGKQKICRNCVDEIGEGGGDPEIEECGRQNCVQGD